VRALAGAAKAARALAGRRRLARSRARIAGDRPFARAFDWAAGDRVRRLGAGGAGRARWRGARACFTVRAV
jgi:hypothetical protein